MLWLLFACQPVPTEASLPLAIVDRQRPEHFFDLPFPSDALLNADGRPDLTGFPHAITPLLDDIVQGWATRLELTAVGWGNNTASYFRFEGPLDLDETFGTEGLPTDKVLLVRMDGGELLPVEGRFVTDPLGDPFYAANTLAMAPALGHPPQSGATYAAVVMRSAGARAPGSFAVPDEVRQALSVAGVSGEPAVATVFTVQDATAQLRTLLADQDQRISSAGWNDVSFRRVTQLAYFQGTTPSGRDATVAEVTYEGGGTRRSYLAPDDPDAYTQEVDLLDWPMAVYEGEINVWNYQGLEHRPYMRAGLGHILDVEEYTGWIDFAGDELRSVPEPETLRITVSIPKDDQGVPQNAAKLLLYDHGTGGHAYNAVQRANRHDQNRVHNELYAEAGWAVIGRDAALYGTRYPLIDEGHGDSLGFYNIVNLPAFRDNQRQTALDGHALLRYVEQQINEDLPEGSIDSSRVRRLGHSLGSVTSNLGVAARPESHEAVLLSGTGGVFALYALETGLIGESIDEETIRSVFPLFGVDAPDELTVPAILGAALGAPEPSWSLLDRLHPVFTLFQWTMDPSDPMAVARDETAPTYVYMGRGDYQVPNRTSEALHQALPQSSFDPCEASWDYDPHQCLWREEEGFAALEAWLESSF